VKAQPSWQAEHLPCNRFCLPKNDVGVAGQALRLSIC